MAICVLLMLIHVLVSTTLLSNYSTFDIVNPSGIKKIIILFLTVVGGKKKKKLNLFDSQFAISFNIFYLLFTKRFIEPGGRIRLRN